MNVMKLKMNKLKHLKFHKFKFQFKIYKFKFLKNHPTKMRSGNWQDWVQQTLFRMKSIWEKMWDLKIKMAKIVSVRDRCSRSCWEIQCKSWIRRRRSGWNSNSRCVSRRKYRRRFYAGAEKLLWPISGGSISSSRFLIQKKRLSFHNNFWNML